MQLDNASVEQLQQWEAELSSQYETAKAQNLQLDLTRGKPSTQQVQISDHLDGILEGNYLDSDGTDTRNYGGLDGIASARKLGADMLGVNTDEIIAAGNSSLTLMYQSVLFASLFGPAEEAPWSASEDIKFICPVPGYDRHFAICEELGIDMITVDMTPDGPDMDAIEKLIAEDDTIKGIWCVPKYQNPTGITFSDETVERLAKLGKIASPNFRIFWDNAYAVHHLGGEQDSLANIMDLCRQQGTEDSVYQFASTSKITHAGAGVAFMAASPANLASFKKHLGITQIGPDKVNQLRHMRLIPDVAALNTLMDQHANLLKPRFEACLDALNNHFGDNDMADWTVPNGGYFISVDTRPGLAIEVIKLAAEAGVKLTPAGATFPYGKDPEDKNIRLAPSFPSIEDVKKTMEIFVTCVKLASVKQALNP